MCLAGAPAAGWPSLWRGGGCPACLGGQGRLVAAAGSGPMAWGRVSAGGPGPELAGVEYCPDAGDLAACDLERVHRHGDAVLLSHQTGLAVYGALQEPDRKSTRLNSSHEWISYAV